MKFLHTADWQIGMRATSFGDRGERVRLARLEAARRVVEVAARETVDFILLAGDTFEDNGVHRLNVREVARILGGAGRPVYLVPGNHDPQEAGSVWEDSAWAEAPNLHLLLDSVPVNVLGGTLFPCPVRERDSKVDPTEWIPRDRNGGIRIGIAHGSVDGVLYHDNTYPIPRDAPERRRLDYLALGHYHSVVIYEAQDCTSRMAYCGTHETTRFGERDSGKALVVEIAAPGAVPVIRPVETGGLRWLLINRNIEEAGALTKLLAEVEQIPSPESALVECDLEGTLFAGEDDIAARLAETIEKRFVFGRADMSHLKPDDEDPVWIDMLPDGYLRQAAHTLLDAARVQPPEDAAVLAFREFSRAWQEVNH